VEFDDSDDEDHHIKPLGSMQVTINGICRGKVQGMEYHYTGKIECMNTGMNHQV
jgi:hypothetical protein